jgi:hypothetical protein
MRVYYDGPDALVTETHFVWRSNPPRTFAVAELRSVRLTRRHVGLSGLGLVLACAGVAALIMVPGWLLLDATAGRLTLIGVALVAVTLVTIWRRTVRRWELRAGYHNREAILYSTPDLTRFNQVTRALRRSIEAGTPPYRRHRATAA